MKFEDSREKSPINMTSDDSVSRNNSFKRHLNAKSFNIFFSIVAVVRRTVILLLQGWYEFNFKRTSGENLKELSTLTYVSFNGYNNEENLNVKKLVGNNRKQMGYKIYLNITYLKRRCYGKYWSRSSLIRNSFNVKHHSPYQSMYS